MSSDYSPDINNDGIIGEDEVMIVKRRVSTHRKIAISAMVTIIFSGLWIMIFASPEKAASIGDVMDFYWIILGGIIATYMGVEVWASK